MRSLLRLLAINFGILLVLVIGLELIFGSWFSKVHALHQFTMPRDWVITGPNLLSGEPAETTYSRDSNGFRGLNGDIGAIDIITVGGSTTDQRFLDDSQTYQAELIRLLNAAGHSAVIANAGIDGQSTFGHIHNFDSWFNRVDGLKTRYFLYYIGINDLVRIAQTDSYDALEAKGWKLRAKLYIREKSAFYQMYRMFKSMYLDHGLGHSINRTNIADAPPFATKPLLGQIETPEVRQAIVDLRARVRELNKLTVAFGAKAIFVTQRSAAWRRSAGDVVGVESVSGGFESELVGQFGPMNGVDIYRIERLVADGIMAECTAVGAVCFDLMEDVDFDPTRDFYDSIHTNASGSAVIAKYLSEKLIAAGIF
ncbi:SGNH/GDSL hydrolase family protein [Rhodobacter sp. SY28-1]|uniref:SGNH/GDSL hydrolase family protein n=1 Tax=Rhodobacter sp. SY28-1 TaxID=2562317 RepID=UPI0010C04B0C|nr:SGNH/GDSL hydrolase family protein [Rhodobacter sp. SY28-1]